MKLPLPILALASAAFVLTAALFFTAPALAQTAQADSEDCWEKAVTQGELTDCAARDMDAAERQMNTLYAIVLDRFRGDPETLGKIRAAQQAWLAFRQAHAEAVFPKAGTPDAQFVYGSSLPMCWASVTAGLTGPRIAQLREWADGVEEGDLCAGSRSLSGN